jgi:hypothetical protein
VRRHGRRGQDDELLDVNTKPIWDITLKLGEITLVAVNIFLSSFPLLCACINLLVVGYLLLVHNGWGPAWLVGPVDQPGAQVPTVLRLTVEIDYRAQVHDDRHAAACTRPRRSRARLSRGAGRGGVLGRGFGRRHRCAARAAATMTLTGRAAAGLPRSADDLPGLDLQHRQQARLGAHLLRDLGHHLRHLRAGAGGRGGRGPVRAHRW